MGNLAETAVADFFRSFLPAHVKCAPAKVMWPDGQSDRQFDLVIYDSKFWTLSLPTAVDFKFVPAEAVLAIVEVKKNVQYSTALMDQLKGLKSSINKLKRAVISGTERKQVPLILFCLGSQVTWGSKLQQDKKVQQEKSKPEVYHLDLLVNRDTADFMFSLASGKLACADGAFHFRIDSKRGRPPARMQPKVPNHSAELEQWFADGKTGMLGNASMSLQLLMNYVAHYAGASGNIWSFLRLAKDVEGDDSDPDSS